MKTKKSEQTVTVEVLESRLNVLRDELSDEMDVKYSEWTKVVYDMKNEIMTGQDKIVKELQDMREENAAGVLQARRVDSTLEDHEVRIKVPEHRKN